MKPGPGQTSVRGFPRPPRLEACSREVVVHWRGTEVARSRRAARVLDTAHPPSFYLPWADVARHLLQRAPGTPTCEWIGPARDGLLVDGARHLPSITWSSQPLAGAEALADCVVFLTEPVARLPPEFLRCRKSRSIRPR